MPTSVRLDGKTGLLVARLAREADVTKSDVIREAIAAYGRRRKPRRARNVYEAIEPWIGAATGGPPDLSERTGEAFAEALRERERSRPPGLSAGQLVRKRAR